MQNQQDQPVQNETMDEKADDSRIASVLHAACHIECGTGGCGGRMFGARPNAPIFFATLGFLRSLDQLRTSGPVAFEFCAFF
eukprot:1814646-Amphidinium_carterae.1